MAKLFRSAGAVRGALGIVFFFSGFAGLVYQVAWQRALTLYYGVGSVSTTLIITIYMLGLGLGALLGGYLAERVRRRVLLYFFVELLIGVFGVLSIPFVNGLGRATAGSSYVVAALCMTLFLCVPTLLMGMTLPIITKIFNRFTHRFLSTVSFLYFINTLGAAFGALFASFVLISFFGLDACVYAAFAVNIILAGLIFAIQDVDEKAAEEEATEAKTEAPAPALDESAPGLGRLAYLLVFITGFLAIGYEIVWFRVVGVLVKASPYAFSSVLAVYLVGIALGSFLMNRYLANRSVDRRNLFFVMQFIIAAYVAVAFVGYYYLTAHTKLGDLTRLSFRNLVHPWFPPYASTRGFFDSLFVLFDVFLWPGLFVLVPTIVMGASFPLASSLALSRPDREASTVGIVYFFNIVGNVLGGLVTGFVLLPLVSSEVTIALFVAVGLGFGLFVYRLAGKPLKVAARVGIVAASLVVALLLLPGPGRLYQLIHTKPAGGFETHLEEGVDTVIVTYKKGDRIRNYIGGMPHGWRPLYLYHYETGEAIAHSKKVGQVLNIGFGNGSIAEIALKCPEVKHVDCVELSDALMRNLRKIPFYRKMLADPRLTVIVDDGRRFLLRTKKRYDLILIDPLRTKTACSNNLYSHEFFSLMRDHLTPGGVLMVWIDEHKVMPKTLLSAFKHVRQYRDLCLASDEPLRRNVKRYAALLANFTPEERAGMKEYEGSYLGDEEYVRRRTKGYPINRDWKPVCEYYLGLLLREKLMGKPKAEKKEATGEKKTPAGT